MEYLKKHFTTIDASAWSIIRMLILVGFLSAFSTSNFAAELLVSVAKGLPPYIIAEQNQGVELDIVREALALKGHSIKTVYLPIKRVSSFFEKGKVDAALTVNESSSLKNALYSDSYITYQNVVIGLAERNLKVETLKDLDRYSLIAFQYATQYLGKDFAAMAKRNAKYSERADQKLQISLLFSKRTDLVVMDINIYRYYKKLETFVDTSHPVSIFKLFTPSNYKVAFRDKAILEDFNEGLRMLRVSGRYQEIIRSYIE